MPNPQHLAILDEGVDVWNRWRKNNPNEEPDLSSANLREENLRGINFFLADLRGVNLIGADLSGANLIRTNLFKADLREANLFRTQLLEADCQGMKLNRASLVKTNLRGANLTGCSIYGISVWDVQLDGAIQSNLIFTDFGEPVITVDDLKVAQFIYLLLDNKEIRSVINTVTSKVVLILGRFTPKRKAVLDALRNELRRCNYTPVLFDFEKPTNRDFTETIITLASMSRFIIADITDANSIAQELYAIIPHQAIPVQPIQQQSQQQYALFPDFKKYPWFLALHRYKDCQSLKASLQGSVIKPAELKAKELAKR